MAEIELRSISKSFGSTEVIKSLDLSVSNGEFITTPGRPHNGNELTIGN
jgi:ABC-type sugar transport system ATPase subunit